MTVNTVESLTERLVALNSKLTLLKQSKGEESFGAFGQRASFAKMLVNWLDAHKDVLKGSPGTNGKNGRPGQPGFTGDVGQDGDRGPTGDPGKNGPDGDRGKVGTIAPSTQYYPNPTVTVDDTLIHPTVTIAQRHGDFLEVNGITISPIYLDIEIKMPKFKIKKS